MTSHLKLHNHPILHMRKQRQMLQWLVQKQWIIKWRNKAFPKPLRFTGFLTLTQLHPGYKLLLVASCSKPCFLCSTVPISSFVPLLQRAGTFCDALLPFAGAVMPEFILSCPQLNLILPSPASAPLAYSDSDQQPQALSCSELLAHSLEQMCLDSVWHYTPTEHTLHSGFLKIALRHCVPPVNSQLSTPQTAISPGLHFPLFPLRCPSLILLVLLFAPVYSDSVFKIHTVFTFAYDIHVTYFLIKI